MTPDRTRRQLVRSAVSLAAISAVPVAGAAELNAQPAIEAEIRLTPSPPRAGDTVTFSGSRSSAAVGSIVSYSWYLDGGAFGSGEEVRETFTQAGSFSMELRVRDSGGNADNTFLNVVVEERDPNAAFSFRPESPEAGERVFFDASSSSDPDGRVRGYEWRVGSDVVGTGSRLGYSFSSADKYLVRLQVTDNDGNRDTSTRTVTVTEASTTTPSTPISTATPVPTSTSTSTPAPTATAGGGSSGGAFGGLSRYLFVVPVVLGVLGLGGVGAWWLRQDDDGGSGGRTAEATDTSGGFDETTPGNDGPSAGAEPAPSDRGPVAEGVPYDSLTDREPMAGDNRDGLYNCRQEGADRPLVLKEMPTGDPVDGARIDRLVSRAESWHEIDDHDSIVEVVGYGTEPGLWVAMEYVDGGDLSARTGELAMPAALSTALAITGAVSHAHEQEVNHLSLRPSNILFEPTDEGPDSPMVTGWGFSASSVTNEAAADEQESQYSAPEQFDDARGSPDERTDVYQLGALLYELFTGEPPYDGSATDIRERVLYDAPRAPSELAEVPAELDSILLRALSTDRADRHESVATLYDDLQELLWGR